MSILKVEDIDRGGRRGSKGDHFRHVRVAMASHVGASSALSTTKRELRGRGTHARGSRKVQERAGVRARAGRERPTLYTPDGKPYKAEADGGGPPPAHSLKQFRDSLDGGKRTEEEVPQARMNFRPPSELGLDQAVDVDPESAAQLIRARAKPWFELAKLLMAMERSGWNSSKIAEATDLDPRMQNTWKTASSVYFSLQADPAFDKELLPYFATEVSPDILAEVRILPSDQRSSAAAFVATHSFQVMQARELSRAIKDWRFRLEGRTGFSNTPGDALAFKYWRDANELKKKGEILAKIENALKVAETEPAIRKLKAFANSLLEEDAPTQDQPTASVIELEQQDMSFTQVSMAGLLGEVSAKEVADAPNPPSTGLFGICRPPNDTKWAILPRWPALQRAVQATCVLVQDGLVVDKALRKANEGKAKPPALLLLERFGVGQERPVQTDLYLVEEAAGAPLQLVLGSAIKDGAKPCAKVLAVIKSPSSRVI